MSSESRQTPGSNVTRRLAINAADAKNTALGAASFLTAATKGRLIAVKSSYNSRYSALASRKYELGTSTTAKNGLAATSRMLNSHFVQVFNLGVERSVFTKEARAFYQIDINSATVPDMGTEALLLQVGSDLVTGDATRLAAGGAAMAMPSIDDVTKAYNNFDGVSMPHSAALDAFDTAQEALDALNDEADKVIKKVWDEVETYYNEEDAASQRDNAREWGVIYVLVGSNKKVSGTVRDSVTNLPIEGAAVTFLNGLKTVITGADGTYELGTTLMGDQAITSTVLLYNDYSETITLVENQDKTWDILMVAVV